MNTATAAAPAITAPIPLADGETYVGLTFHADALHHLVLLPGDEAATFKQAEAFAAKAGGVLPSRHDMLVLFAKARAEFQREWYWTGETRADDASYAWYQLFSWGTQGDVRKGFERRVRAVRRVAL